MESRQLDSAIAESDGWWDEGAVPVGDELKREFGLTRTEAFERSKRPPPEGLVSMLVGRRRVISRKSARLHLEWRYRQQRDARA